MTKGTSYRHRSLTVGSAIVAVALAVGVAQPAMANSSPLSGTQPENAWYNYSNVRSNAQGNNSVDFEWTGNDLGGGGMEMYLRAYTSGAQITPTTTPPLNQSIALTYSPTNSTDFPNGSFTITSYLSAACGQPCGGNGLVTFSGDIWWNLPW